ncbi:VOC family protein [Curtobacterium sp. Leaf261]|uniref:VOC family protein n=1 Tax=Curtobacterium sp. Leaf261 TaxID=1736311 RepID=UPI0006F9953A|nr:VOC family protein [Curtobacterium sp. Leaf261]KQO63444.1 glyoxalase [Curtobacterium sp. Leaf261]
MAIPAIDYAHVRITVTDIARSRKFYDDVFGFEVLAEAPPEDADQATKDAMWWVFGGVVYQFHGGVFGVRPVAPAGDEFDPDRVGLDHVSFAVPSRDDLDAAATLLDGLGIAHEGVKDIGSGLILEFRDPDGIALELFTPTAG